MRYIFISLALISPFLIWIIFSMNKQIEEQRKEIEQLRLKNEMKH